MLSVIIPCKGRLQHLKETFQAVLSQRMPTDQVIVVDYDCPDETEAWLVDQDILGVGVVKLKNAPLLNLAHARNLGARAARPSSEILIFLDADSVPQPGWLTAVIEPIRSGEFGLVHCAPGSCSVSKELFYQINGYDESFEGWGDGEYDFWSRCEAIRPATTYPMDLLHIIDHSDEMRTEFFFEKNKEANQNRSSQHRRSKKGKPVNPNGWGRMDFRADPEGRFL